MLADVIVVGAGLAGLATAWHLRRYARVLVVDRAPAPATESSDHSAAIVRRTGEDPVERTLVLRTVEWLADPGDDWDGRPPSRVVGAVLAVASDPSLVHDAIAHVRARGVRAERCDRPAEIAPVLAGSPVRGAWWIPDERVADPPALAAGFLRGLREAGGEVRCGVTVTSLAVREGRVAGVETDRGFLAAGHVVVAAGAWARALAATAGLDRPLHPLRRTIHRTAPDPRADRAQPWAWIDDVGLYARPDGGAWLVCGCDEALDVAAGPGSRRDATAAARAHTAAKIARFMPALASVPLASGWSGLRTFAPDRRPLLGPDGELPGLSWCAGLGGFGVGGSYGAGEAVAAWFRGESVGWLKPGPVAPHRPPLARWPIRPDGDVSGSVLVAGRQ